MGTNQLAVDIVKPAPKTELEAWNRWRNNLQSSLTRLNRYRTKIVVKG